MEQDIRWEQRFFNFKKALFKLEASVSFIIQMEDNSNVILQDLIKQGLIQSFEFTHELAWNVMKDYAYYQGNSDIKGSRDATREGFAMGLIPDGEVWMEMIGSRNKSSHTYDEETAKKIYDKILQDYFPAFLSFKEVMEELQSNNLNEI